MAPPRINAVANHESVTIKKKLAVFLLQKKVVLCGVVLLSKPLGVSGPENTNMRAAFNQ